MQIEFTLTPTSTDIDFLTEKINEGTPGYGTAYPFGFFMRDEDENIIAGCNGSVIFGRIYTDQLWVHPDHRGKGLGRMFMEHVHDYGRQEGCSLATVNTMSFQGALSFYEKLGYTMDFERKGYAKGSSLLCLKKEL